MLISVFYWVRVILFCCCVFCFTYRYIVHLIPHTSCKQAASEQVAEIHVFRYSTWYRSVHRSYDNNYMNKRCGGTFLKVDFQSHHVYIFSTERGIRICLYHTKLLPMKTIFLVEYARPHKTSALFIISAV